MPATGHDTLTIDIQRGCLHYRQRQVRLRGRWDLPFLAVLANGTHGNRFHAAERGAVQAALAAYGLDRPLAHTQWARIVQRLRRAMDELDATGQLTVRLQHPQRGMTTGPWWLVRDGKLAVHCRSMRPARSAQMPGASASGAGAAAAAAAAAVAVATATAARPASPAAPLPLGDDGVLDPALGLARHADTLAAVRLAYRFHRAMDLRWRNNTEQARTLLQEDGAWAQESPALGALRRLRLAELHVGVRAFGTAQALLDVVQTTVATHGLTLLQGHVDAARWRLAYAQDPLGSARSLGQGLRHVLGRGGGATGATPAGAAGVGDITSRAEAAHLLLLCERRRWEQVWPGLDAERRRHSHPTLMLQAGHHALLLLFMARSYERAQHVCANLAYAHQRMAHLGMEPRHDTLAVEWHALAIEMDHAVSAAESSAWEYIFLGELWLMSARARHAWQLVQRQKRLSDVDPSRLAFYTHACDVAQALGDTRQQAYAERNRWQFGRDTHALDACNDARRQLARLLRAEPDLKRLLTGEHYPMPRLPTTG